MSLVDFFGRIVGQLEMHGLPAFWVKHYRAWVTPTTLMRGSRLSDEEFVSLLTETPPIRSILNLCAENDDDTKRLSSVGNAYRVEHIPVIDNYPFTMRDLDYVIAWISDPQNQPCYVHCEAGIGRTGVAVAAWRIHGGWTADRALAEARTFGHLVSEQEECVRQYAVHLQ